MSTLELENIKHPDNAGNNITLAADGTIGGINITGNVGIGTTSPKWDLGFADYAGNLLDINSTTTNEPSVLALTSTGTNTTARGIISFQNLSQTAGSARMAQIQAERTNTSTTALDADLAFSTSQAGTLAERMRIDSVGRVTMPNQPAFMAILSVNNQSGDLVMTDVQTNIGSHYNSGTGRFTAPVAGAYYFAMTSLEQGGNGAIRLKKNGALFGVLGYMDGINANSLVIGIHTLNSGDYVSAYAYVGVESNYTSFSGYLIG